MSGSTRLVRIAMQDGAMLATAVALPHAGFRGPALLVRTPYEGDLPGSTCGLEPEQVLAAGFALVAQDVRGRVASTGRFGFLGQERADGRRTLAWIATQPWSDGRVATAGTSYLGRAQLVLDDARPTLVAMIPASAGLGSSDTWRPGGSVDLGVAGAWIERVARPLLGALPAAQAQPLRALLDSEDPAATVRAALTPGHPLRRLVTPLLPALHGRDERSPAPCMPSLHVCGWFDVASGGTIDAWSAARAGAPDHHLIVGPWGHDDLGATHAGRTFPGGAARDLGLAERLLAFLGCYVHGEGAPPPAAEVYVTGADAWRAYPSWPPPARARELRLTGADTLVETDAAAAVDGSDALVLASRARDPAPALGGPSTGLTVPGPAQMRAGPAELGPLAARPDVLLLRSAPLAAPLELAGSPQLAAHVHAEPGPPGLVARLAELTPDGALRTLAAGVATAPAPPSGAPARLDVALSPLHHRLAAGSRIALLLTASSYPHYLLGLDRDRVQRVLTDPGHRTVLRLPVVH